MDFNFKKARNTKRKEDKARSAHHGHSGHKTNSSNQKPRENQRNEQGCTSEKPALLTETSPVISQQETQDAISLRDTKSYSRRSVVSNWERYELPADTQGEEPDEALDFETLINSLSDVKGHLKLSHEQSWGDERSELQEVFFNIDMHQLFASLERVPFHTRQNVPAPMFTSEQLTVFEQDADIALKQSCDLKVTQKDTMMQKITEIPKKELDHDTNTTKSLGVLSNSPETSDSSINDNIEEPSPSINLIDAKPPQSIKEAESTRSAEKLLLSAVPAASSKSDELDLDFLLSLDAAVPDKPKLKEIGAGGISAVIDMKPIETGKLDDWLDDLLDD